MNKYLKYFPQTCEQFFKVSYSKRTARFLLVNNSFLRHSNFKCLSSSTRFGFSFSYFSWAWAATWTWLKQGHQVSSFVLSIHFLCREECLWCRLLSFGHSLNSKQKEAVISVISTKEINELSKGS